MAKSLDGDVDGDGSTLRASPSNPMSHGSKPAGARTAARVSPAAARGPRVVDLRAWREAHGTSTVGARNVRPGARPVGQAPRPDRLGRALAWCQAFTATGRNPFDPARLQQDLD